MSASRALLFAAVVAGALYLVGAIALGTPPKAQAPGGEIVGWMRDHENDVRLYAWTAAVGTLAFAVAIGIIRGLLPAPARDVFMLGAAAFIVETGVQAWLWAGLALHPATLQPATARTVLDVAIYWGPVLTGATTAMIGAVTVTGFGARPAIPRWLVVLGVVAFAEQLIETVTVFGTHGFIEPGGAMNLLLGAGLTAVWLVGLVVWAFGRLRAGAAQASAT